MEGVVTPGSSQVEVRFKDISDVPIKVFFRKTGTTGIGEFVELTPGASSGNITIPLTIARTIEYYVEGGGTIECWVVDYGGGGVVVSIVTVADIRTTLLSSAFSSSEIPDASISEFIGQVTRVITRTADKHARIAGYAVADADKVYAIKMGAAALTLYALRSIGASKGHIQDNVVMSTETADRWYAIYDRAAKEMESGIVY